MTELTIRQQAFVDLLAQQDPWDLPPRRHAQTHPGDPNRRGVQRQRLLVAWAMHRDVAVDGEELPGPAQRVTFREIVQAKLARLVAQRRREVEAWGSGHTRTR